VNPSIKPLNFTDMTKKQLSQNYILKLLTIFISILLVSVTIQLKAQNILQIMNASVIESQQVTISIHINNANPFVGFQLDIPIPAAFSYVGNSAALNQTRSNGHLLQASLISGNILRIIVFSINNTPFTGNSGEVAFFKLLAGTAPGSYTLAINNALIANAASNNIMTSAINGTLTLQAPNIQVTPSSQDFGNNPLGTYSDRIVVIQNTGNLPLNVSDISFNSPHFVNLGSGIFTLAAGQSTSRTIRFNATVKGTYNKQMTIHSGDPDAATVTVSLNAVAFAVNELHCGNIQAASGTTATLTLSINNMEPFVGFQFDLLLPSPLTYINGTVSLNPSRSNGHQATASMINANTLRVVGFSVNNQTFSGNDGEVLSLGFQVNGTGGWYPLSLSGVIIGDVDGNNSLSASYGSNLTITAPDIHANSGVNFGDIAINMEGNQVITVFNYGQEILIIDAITFTNPAFSTLTTLPISIAPWNSHQINVVFDPLTTGTNNGQMRVFSNDPDENPFIVSLSANAFSPNYLTVSNITSSPGTSITLPVSIENYDTFVGFQFDLTLPEGVNYIPNSAQLNPARKQDHQLSMSVLGNGMLRILAFSMQQSAFLGNSGDIVFIGLSIDEGIALGNYPLNLNNGILGNVNSQNILWAANNGELTLVTNNHLLELNFSQGYTWFSLNVNPGSMTPASLFSALTPCYDDRVIGQTSFALYTGSNWIGSLTNLGMDKMYRMKLCSAQNLSLMGDAALLNPINLNAGYTWLGYQPQQCQSVGAAMTGLSPGPSYDDRVIGQSSFALFTGTTWIGSLTQMCPGKGYVVKLANAQTLTYTAPSAKGSSGEPEAIELVSPIGIYPSVNHQHTMMVVAKLQLPDGIISLNEKDVVYAYMNGEVRGMANPMPHADGAIFLSIADNEDLSKPITFTVWLDERQELLPLNEALSFEALAAVGNLDNPFIFTLGEMVGVNEEDGGIWIEEPYPNPFEDFFSINFKSSSSAKVNFRIYNSLGQKVSQSSEYFIQTDFNNIKNDGYTLTKGIYLLEVMLIQKNINFIKHFKIIKQ